MFLTPHELTEGEKRCLEEYEREKSKKPRKNLIKLVRHINMLNPVPDEHSWEYIFFDRQLSDEQVDFALKMQLRHKYTIKELAEKIAAAAGFEGKISWNSSKPDGMYRKLMDSSRAHSLGWKPEISLDEGIKRTIQEYKQDN